MRRALLSTLTIIGACAFDAPSAYAEMTTEQLVKECGGLDLEKFDVTDDASALCYGYINGAIASMMMRQVSEKKCWIDIPSGTPPTDFPIILMRYLKANPPAIKMPPPQSIYAATTEAFPCGRATTRSD